IFRPLQCCDPKDCYAFSGFSLKPAYISGTFLPQMIPPLLQSCDIDDRDSVLALGIIDENSDLLYTNHTGNGTYEVKLTFAPAFPRWKLAVGYKNTTIEQLAQGNFSKHLALTVLLLGILILGIIMMLHATSREMKLASAKSTFVSNV